MRIGTAHARATRTQNRRSAARRIPVAALLAFFICIVLPRPGFPAKAPVPFESYRTAVSRSGTFVLHYAEGLSKPAREIEMLLEESAAGIARDLGLEDIRPIQVYLVSDEKAYARLHGGRIPEWGVAFADLNRGLLGVNVELVSRDPGSFGEVARHELSHLLLGQRVGNAAMPTWFMEGLAMVQERGWDFGDEWSFMMTAGRVNLPYLEELRGAFPRTADEAAMSYGLSYIAVAELLRGRPGAVITLTSFLRDTGDFNAAFVSTFGLTTYDFGSKLYVSVHRRYKIPGTLLNAAPYWAGLALLFVAVYLIKRYRNRRKLERWAEEEARESRIWY